jgi:DNA-binding transcriptional ArsR family regulator
MFRGKTTTTPKAGRLLTSDVSLRAYCNVPIDQHEHFAYDETMNVGDDADAAVSTIAAAIGEPARARILYCLVDGQARTSTELSVVADVSPSTTSVHLDRLKTAHPVNVLVQGKHRFYSLAGPDVDRALEGLSVLAGGTRVKFAPSTPSRLRVARTCYDHMAGTLGVLLHDRFKALGWLSPVRRAGIRRTTSP